LARIVGVGVRSANNSPWHSFNRFSISPRWQYTSSALAAPALARAVAQVRELACRLTGSLGLAPCLPQLGRDLGDQPPVAGEAEHVAHVVGLAPAHQVVAAEPTVGAEHDAGRGPALADLSHNAGNFLDTAFRRIGAR